MCLRLQCPWSRRRESHRGGHGVHGVAPVKERRDDAWGATVRPVLCVLQVEAIGVASASSRASCGSSSRSGHRAHPALARPALACRCLLPHAEPQQLLPPPLHQAQPGGPSRQGCRLCILDATSLALQPRPLPLLNPLRLHVAYPRGALPLHLALARQLPRLHVCIACHTRIGCCSCYAPVLQECCPCICSLSRGRFCSSVLHDRLPALPDRGNRLDGGGGREGLGAQRHAATWVLRTRIELWSRYH